MGVELGEYAGGSSKFEESQSMFTWPKKDNRVIRSMTTSVIFLDLIPMVLNL